MKVLIATDKPFAKVAVDGIRKEIEAAGFELALLEKYTEKAQLLDAVKDANAIIIRSDIIDAEVLDAAKELKIVVRGLRVFSKKDITPLSFYLPFTMQCFLPDAPTAPGGRPAIPRAES